jgi:hypothetical protein
MTNLWGITCYFNPVGYRRRLQNYHVFRRRLGIPLVAVELGYGEDFDLREDAADILIRLKGADVMWQKERLLNLALAALPGDCDAVAWLDCDVVFADADWAERASAALERFALLQPFQTAREPPPDDRGPSMAIADDARPGYSLAYLLSRGEATPEILRGNMRLNHRTNSGFAWVARRELLDRDGFYDACVLGSGNRAMLCAALGTPADAVDYLQMTPAWEAHYRAWAARHSKGAGAAIGCIEGALVHLWHGDLAHRRYLERHREFSAFGFDPATDIALDANGIWRWSSDKPGMHEYAAGYFRARREDGGR